MAASENRTMTRWWSHQNNENGEKWESEKLMAPEYDPPKQVIQWTNDNESWLPFGGKDPIVTLGD